MSKASVWLIVLFVFLGLVVFGGGGYAIYKYTKGTKTTPVATNVNQNVNANKNANTNSMQESCDFTKEVILKAGTNYSMMGDEEFDTVVCGYFTKKDIPVDEIMGTDAHVNAYFVITKFKDAKFQASMDKSLSEGNTVNEKSSSKYQFNLGCYENNTISDDTGTVFGSGVKEKILKSTKSSPVALILSFQKHDGRGCNCCNLAEKITLY